VQSSAFFFVILLATASIGAQAALIDRGEGFIYDDVLDVTWTQNANINGQNTWANQVTWAAGYSQTHSVYGTFEDWRLASVDVNDDGTIFNGCGAGPSFETDCRDNEYGYLRWQYGITASAPGLFTGLPVGGGLLVYWSGTEEDSLNAWAFDFDSGTESDGLKSSFYYGWAVRDGDVAASVVPIPAAAWLFGSALGLLGWLKRRR
jgi:hypothetical protein